MIVGINANTAHKPFAKPSTKKLVTASGA